MGILFISAAANPPAHNVQEGEHSGLRPIDDVLKMGNDFHPASPQAMTVVTPMRNVNPLGGSALKLLARYRSGTVPVKMCA